MIRQTSFMWMTLAFAAMLLFGCNKASKDADTNAEATQAGEAVKADDAAKPNDSVKAEDTAKPNDSVKAEDTAKADDAQKADDAANADETNAGDEETKPMPETKIVSTQVDQPWGKIQHDQINWDKSIDIFYEYPVFNETVPASAKLNATFAERRAHYFSPEQLQTIWEYQSMREQPIADESKFLYTSQATLTEFSDQYVSGKDCTEWFMGGVYNGGCSGYTFSAQTGDPIELTTYSKKSITELRKAVESALKAQLSERSLSEGDIEWNKIRKAERFNYYVENGKAHVVFGVYEISYGAAGAFDIVLP